MEPQSDRPTPDGSPGAIVEHDSREDKVRSLLPTHDALYTAKGEQRVKAERRRPGRPLAIEQRPTISDLEYHAEMSAAKQDFIEQDIVVQAALGKVESADLLHLIKAQVAKEAAALEFQRIEDEKRGGRGAAQISTRRIDALTKIANIELEIKKFGGDVLDLKGEKFQRVFKLLIESFQEVASEVLSPEQVEILFNRLGTALEGWEERAALAIVGKGPGK